MSSQREIRLNAFDMNCVGHQSPGLWAHPRDRSWQYKDLEYWVDLARLLERGKFDGLFIADVLGIYDVLNGSGDAAIRQATQVPVNDPLALITPMALVTEHLGFGLTASLSFEHPYPFARRLSTLDHLTKGRVGWNIVTSYLESGARNIGQQTQTDHDTRYDYADEYLQVIYKLLEGSWEDGAVLRDRERKIFSDPRKIHPINHQGQFFSVPGIHLCEPSPQRTPVLYQAGASSRGKQFAAGHAECVFVAAPSKVLLKKTVADIRRRAAEAGRDPHSILIFNLQTVIVGDTDREAQAKWQEYKQYVSYEGALALRPSVLLADEATSGLDPQATASVLALLKRLRDEYQLAIVLITHEMDAVRTAADAVAEIRDGTIVQYGRIEDLLARPDSLLGQQLLPLTPAAATHSDLLLRLSYRWDVPVATDWISRLSQQWALQIDLLGGHVEVINGRLAGRLQAGVRFQGERLSPARLQGLLAQLGITAEILDSAPLLREAV